MPIQTAKDPDETLLVLGGRIQYDKKGFIKCRVCGCTEHEPCNPPCAWFFPDLCTTCALATEALMGWSKAALHANWAALKREVLTQLLFQEGD